MGFFDIDDILAGQQRIQCTFERTVPKLGFFDVNSDTTDIQEGTKMDLPSWLARELYKTDSDSIISVEIPRSYSSVCRAILDADAHVVDLNKLGPFFYTAGMDFLSYCTPEMHDMGKMLVQAFTNRFRWILEKGMNAGDDRYLMDRSELKIYAAAQASTKSYARWISRESELLLSSDITNAQKKLKTGT